MHLILILLFYYININFIIYFYIDSVFTYVLYKHYMCFGHSIFKVEDANQGSCFDRIDHVFLSFLTDSYFLSPFCRGNSSRNHLFGIITFPV